jgi:hypothetical protein
LVSADIDGIGKNIDIGLFSKSMFEPNRKKEKNKERTTGIKYININNNNNLIVKYR